MSTFDSYTDEGLFLLLKEGNFAAFNELYNRYWKILFALSEKKLKNALDAEELVHDVFIDLWNQKERIELVHSFKSYLAGMVKFKVYAKLALYYKYEKNNMPLSDSLEAPSAEFSAEEKYRLKELKEEILKAVNTLPDRCRLIYTLSREEGLTHRQIAKKLNISEKTIETQITRALHRLKGALQSLIAVFF